MASPIVTASSQAFAARAVVEPDWLAADRAAALARFVELGVPGRREEAWRFTDTRPLTEAHARVVPDADHGIDPERLAAHRLSGQSHFIAVVNGRVRPDLSAIGELPRGVWLGSVSDTIDLRPDLLRLDTTDSLGKQPFASLNAALFTDGFVLAIEPGIVLTRPVEILYLGDGTGASHVRNTIAMGAECGASIVETYAGSGPLWTNVVSGIDVGAGATLRHVVVQAQDTAAIHFSVARAQLAASAHYNGFVLITGARLSRQDIQVALAGKAARLTLNGAWLLRGDQEATIAPSVDHQAPGGETNELLKGVLSDKAHGVFLGSVMVRAGADGTNARQLNRNLLTSPTARVDTRPELTIYADEVKCGHGATVGDLDEAALFYLLSRGIDPETARHMLIEAFAAEALDTAALPTDIDAHVRRYLNAWLA
jgi:Fe-S cluster assembly protein SufD